MIKPLCESPPPPKKSSRRAHIDFYGDSGCLNKLVSVAANYRAAGAANTGKPTSIVALLAPMGNALRRCLPEPRALEAMLTKDMLNAGFWNL